MKLGKKKMAIFMLALSLMTTSCSSEEVAYYTIEGEDLPDPTKERVSVSSNEPIDEVKETIQSKDAIDEEGLFFEKVSPGTIVTLDDIILTNKEKGIETNLQDEIALTNALKEYQENLTEEEKETLEKLHVRDLAETCYLSSIMTNYIEKHTYSSLYLEEEDDLDWSLLFSTLKENAYAYQLDLLEKIDTADESMKTFYEREYIETLSDEDLEIWIHEFHEFILLIRAEYPNFDMRRLACVLEDYTVGYEKEKPLNKYTYASTGAKVMSYPLWDGYYPNFANFKQHNYHEFRHLIGLAGTDEENEFGDLHCGGMWIYSTIKYMDEYKEVLGNIKLSDEYFPFSYHFIEEATAEMKSSSLLEVEPTTYTSERFIMNTIEYSLFLEDSYTNGNIEKAMIYHNPIALIEQFPIMDIEEEEWFYSQLEMLEAYNVCNKDIKWILFNADLEENESEELKKNRLITLENHADLQMMRNFIWTLINCKDKGLTVEDYDFLLHLMETRVNLNRDELMKNNDLNTLTSASYQEGREKLIEVFEEYINIFAEEPYTYRFLDDSWKEHTLSDAFTEEEKAYIEELTTECGTFQEEREPFSREETIKKYYLVP